MKPVATLFLTTLAPFMLSAQNLPVKNELNLSEEAVAAIASILETTGEIKNCDQVVWRLYPTDNMWTFLKLNTRNGVIFQLQYDVDGEDRMESILNAETLVESNDAVNGRFTLYPTKNMWTFILLDQIDGRAYQVQWSQKEDNRFIIPILGISHLKDLAK